MAISFGPTVEFFSWRKKITNLCNDFDTVSSDLPPHHDPLHFRFNQDSSCYAPSIVSQNIAAAESLMAQYEEISSQLQGLQSNVQKQMQSLQLWTENHKSLIAPVRLLSPDLIDLIMEHFIEASTPYRHICDPAVRSSHVCSTWRSQALNHPVLWSKFLIHPFPIPKADKIHHMIDRIDTLTSRSYPFPLDVGIYDYDRDTSTGSRRDIDDMGLDIIVPPILESLLRVSDRLKSLYLRNAFLYPSVFPTMNLPLLDSLTLSGTYLRTNDFFPPIENVDAIFLAAPQLRNLIVKDHSCHGHSKVLFLAIRKIGGFVPAKVQ